MNRILQSKLSDLNYIVSLLWHFAMSPTSPCHLRVCKVSMIYLSGSVFIVTSTHNKACSFNKSRDIPDCIVYTVFYVSIQHFECSSPVLFNGFSEKHSRKQNHIFSALSNSSTHCLKSFPAVPFHKSYVWKLLLIFLHVGNGFALFATPACRISNILLKENFKHEALFWNQARPLWIERKGTSSKHFPWARLPFMTEWPQLFCSLLVLVTSGPLALWPLRHIPENDVSDYHKPECVAQLTYIHLCLWSYQTVVYGGAQPSPTKGKQRPMISKGSFVFQGSTFCSYVHAQTSVHGFGHIIPQNQHCFIRKKQKQKPFSFCSFPFYSIWRCISQLKLVQYPTLWLPCFLVFCHCFKFTTCHIKSIFPRKYQSLFMIS